MPNFKIERVFSMNDEMASQISQAMDEGKSWDREQGELFLKNPDNALFLATVEEKIVGFLSGHRLQRFDDRKAEVLIYEVGVNEDNRRKGIAKAMLHAVKNWAKEVGADEAWVLTYSSNEAGMALYKSAGGEEDEPGTRMFTFGVK
jgi:aminoglycoside 3-N-acetyltransferase I